MKTNSVNSFDFENETVTGLNIQADQNFNHPGNGHGGLGDVSQPWVVAAGAADGVDVNVLHMLSALETQAFQAPAVVEDVVPTEELGLILMDASAGCRMAFPRSEMAPAVEQWADALTAESGVEMTIAPEIQTDTSLIDRPVLFKGWLGVDAPQIEVEPIVVDTAGDSAGDADASAELPETVASKGDGTEGNSTDASIDVPEIQVCEGYPAPETVELNGEPEVILAKESQDTELNAVEIDAPAENTSTGNEAVDVSAVEPAVETFEPTICIDMPIVVVDPVVWMDGGAFVFQFPEVFLAQPAIDSVEANGTDTLPPELMTCDGDPMPEILTFKGEPEIIFSKEFVETESDAAEITLTGVAEGHLA